MTLYTHQVRFLSEKEINNLKYDLNFFELYADVHDDGTTNKKSALNQGKTVWLKKPNLDYINKKIFLKTIEIIENIKYELKFVEIGKCYIHKLYAGQTIPLHFDIYPDYFNNILRYQMVLDIPKKLEIIQKNSAYKNNSLIFFNHNVLHGYNNKSSDDFVIYVIDFKKIL